MPEALWVVFEDVTDDGIVGAERVVELKKKAAT